MLLLFPEWKAEHLWAALALWTALPKLVIEEILYIYDKECTHAYLKYNLRNTE